MSCCRYLDAATAVSTADGNFENSTYLAGDLVIKRYTRAERYLAEVSALEAFASSGRCPALISSCAEHLTVTMTRLDGVPAVADFAGQADPADAVRQTAAALRELHLTGAEWLRTRLPGWDLAADFSARTGHRITSLGIGGAQYEQCLAWLADATELVGGATPVLLHHDTKPANVLIGSDRIRLVDFDQSRPGHPFSDLGKAVWRLAPGSAELRSLLVESYLGHAPDATEARLVSIYRTCHALGALAYWHDFRPAAYRHHAVSASVIVLETLGVRVGPSAENLEGAGHAQ